MKNLHSQTSLLLFFIITAANLLSPSLSDESAISLTIEICERTTQPKTCRFVLQREVVWPKTDLAGMARITMGAALSYATSTLKLMQESGVEERDPYGKTVYESCVYHYKGVVKYMTGASYYAQKGHYKAMVSQLRLATTPLSKCNNLTLDGGFIDITERNKFMEPFIEMGLYEGQNLQNNDY